MSSVCPTGAAAIAGTAGANPPTRATRTNSPPDLAGGRPHAPPCLKSIIESAIRDREELGHDVPSALAAELTRMSASTMCRWGALAPCWNRGAEATTNALAHLLEQLPFPPKVIHVDRNAPEPKAKGHGSKFLNHHLLAFLRTHHPDVRLTRSRPYRKNDNNRIEQKNGSVVRALFGDLRFGDHAQLAPLTALCDQWSLLHNLAIPCRRQVTHHRHVTSRGVTHTRAFDRPQTPWQRLNALRPQPRDGA